MKPVSTILLLAMRVSLVFLIALSSFSIVDAAPVLQTDRDRAELLGPVKMVVAEFQTLKTYDKGTPDPSRLPAFTEIYDQRGNLLERKNFTPDFIDDQHLERYDAETVLISSKMGDKRQLMKFDSAGKLIRMQIFVGLDGKGPMLDDTRYRYDAAGREIEEDLFDEDGKSRGVLIITRDSAENIVGREYRFVHGGPFPLIRHYRYEFDSRGNWIKQIQSSNDPEHNQKDLAPYGILYRAIAYFDTTSAPPTPLAK